PSAYLLFPQYFHLLHHYVRIFFFQSYGTHRVLHSFPTRRSSDLTPSAMPTFPLQQHLAGSLASFVIRAGKRCQRTRALRLTVTPRITTIFTSSALARGIRHEMLRAWLSSPGPSWWMAKSSVRGSIRWRNCSLRASSRSVSIACVASKPGRWSFPGSASLWPN